MSAALCKECGRRPKATGRHRCITCLLRISPIGDQVTAAKIRLAMVPPEMRVKRTKAIVSQSPAGTSWCAGCQSFRDLLDFGSGATKCRACTSAKAHAAMVAKTYGITSDDYDTLLDRQGGKCAICRARPKSKRLAVDHDHKTGAVRGLLCGRCNHDLMGSAWDSIALASSLWHYLNTPPSSGTWPLPETAPKLMPVSGAVRPSPASDGRLALVTRPSSAKRGAPNAASMATECATPHFLPVGSERVPGKRGVWRYYADDDPAGDAPF